MATSIIHCQTHIITLEADEAIAGHCRPGDIALIQEGQGWWTHFVGENGQSETYDEPFTSYREALIAAKAAAEFSSASE